MKLIEIIEEGNMQFQIEVNANSKEDVKQLGYEDFDIWLYINKEKVAYMNTILLKSNVFMQIIDEIDWVKKYCDNLINE